ncbi:MAG TPA: YetF domain-containing protein [Gemmatimonadaceae bacterium]|nr:YetF domain-containing protein [Gemmatimonadaceae bacterium]
MWHDLLTPGIPITEKIVRSLLVYVFLLVGLRLAGKREMSQLNSFDLVVLLLLSNTVQNAIIGNDNSLTGGLFGAAVLLIVNSVLVRTLYHYGKLDKLEGRPDVLIRNGRLLRRHLERELITVSELESAARRQGIDSLAHVSECRLETGGALSFIQRHPTDDEQRHHEMLGLLGQIDARQRAMAEQLEAVERKLAGADGTTP